MSARSSVVDWDDRFTVNCLVGTQAMRHVIDIRRPFNGFVIWTLMAMSLLCFGNSHAARNDFRISPLCEAIVSNNVERATRLVEQGADVNAGYGCALSMAASRDQLKLVELLLDCGANPNRIVSGDRAELMGSSSPLVAAVQSRDVLMVRLLLERGSEPRDEFDAFQIVLNFNNVEMAELLLRFGANANMTHPAAKRVYAFPDRQMVEVQRGELEPGRLDDTVKRLNCSISDSAEGTSLLYMAAGGAGGPKGIGGPGTSSLEQIVKLLLGHGADPNAKTLNGSTPLMYAASQHHHAIMTMLMDAGADVEAADRCGRTAEDYAVLYPRSSRAHFAQETKALLQERRRE